MATPNRQARYHVKFSNLRYGIPHEGTDREIQQALQYEREWRARPPRNALPRKSVPSFVYPPRGMSMRRAAAHVNEPVLYSAMASRPRLTEDQSRRGKRTVNQIARFLYNLGFRYHRTLGWGGEGIAALMYVVDTTGQWRGAVVGKMALTEGSAFNNEWSVGQRFRGQYHILQRQYGVDLAGGDQQAAALFDLALHEAAERLMLFEFAQFGSLSNLLKKATAPLSDPDDPLGLRATRGRPLPDRALLHIFQCLASACNHMRAPAFAAPPAKGQPPQAPTSVVHFDLEPSNMLFGGGEAVPQADHALMPILKVSDLGLSGAIPPQLANEALVGCGERVGEQKRDGFYRYVGRGCGSRRPSPAQPSPAHARSKKANTKVQEQFSQDWDYCVANPVAENIETYGQVAGHYGPASNVYHIGLTLWCCITGTWPELPTYSRLAHNPIPRVDGKTYYAWGTEILDDSKYGTVDRQIREMVISCLAEEPRIRLDSDLLLQWCGERIAEIKNTPGSTDADLFNWAMANMSAPPFPTPGVPTPSFDPGNPDDEQFDPFDPQWTL